VFRFLRPSFRPSAASAWRVAALAAAAVLIWVAYHQRWTPASWHVPTDYYVDAHETLARLKAASEGDIVPFAPQVIERLGAPFGAHWNAYPTPDKPLMALLGALVHAVGLFAAANLGLVLAQVTAALAFYFVARWLRCRWEWAFAGALLFAYAYHTFHRGLSHYSLVFTWTVPIGLLAVWCVAGSRRLEWTRPLAALCLAVGVAFGASNPYNLFFWLQLMGWALVFQALGPRRRANLGIGVAAIAAALVTFVLVHVETWLHVEDPGALPLLARNYGGTERYALKVVEMFIPPPYHAWEPFSFFGYRYLRWSEWRGEAFLPYLGLAGIAGLVWLAVVTLRRLIARRPVPGQALTLGWIVAYASIGGLTNVLAFFAGFQVFRATNRAAIFVSAIVLLFLVARLSRLTGRWPAAVRFAAAAVLAAVGVLDQLPRRESPADLATVAHLAATDLEFGQRLEAAFPPGASVFQLPILGFPEVAVPHRIQDYEHVRPYLVTRTLQFSYGAPKGRARSAWQHDLEGLPAEELVERLEAHGFAALYINRLGFTDAAAALLGSLERLGYRDRIADADDRQIVVRLRPAASPRPPLAANLTYGQGWYRPPEAGVHWTHSAASASYFNPFPHPIRVELRFALHTVGPRTVELLRDDRLLHRFDVGAEPAPQTLTDFELLPGVNRFVFRSDAPALRLGQGPNQLRSFGLGPATVRTSSPPFALGESVPPIQ
jgi:phosphoglycerol transferase